MTELWARSLLLKSSLNKERVPEIQCRYNRDAGEKSGRKTKTPLH